MTPLRTVAIGVGGLATAGALAALAGCAAQPGTASSARASSAPASAAPSSSSASASASSGASSAAAASYRDGAYSADGVYGSGPSSIGVRITLAGGRITAATVTPHATDATSLDYQRRYAQAVPATVVGRPIAGLSVGHLAGSILTQDGFNDALEKIRAEAAA